VEQLHDGLQHRPDRCVQRQRHPANGSMTMTSDGANLLDPGNQGTQTANVNQNQVAEVSILTSAYGAESPKAR